MGENVADAHWIGKDGTNVADVIKVTYQDDLTSDAIRRRHIMKARAAAELIGGAAASRASTDNDNVGDGTVVGPAKGVQVQCAAHKLWRHGR